MAGRIAQKEQDAIFRPYAKANDAQKSETAKVVGKDVTKLKPPIVEDTANSSGSTHATSKKKKKKKEKKKKPKEESSVSYQFLFEGGD
jgi:hypothetical protein